MDFFCTVPRPQFLGRALIWPGYFGEHIIFSAFLDYILRVCQSLRDSFFCLGELHWFLYLLLSYYYDPGMFIFCWSSNFVEKLCWMRAWRRGWHLVSPTLYIIIVYRVNLNKWSRNFVGALRTTTTNCSVSFIDLYLVFPRNFRILFLPHANTVILLDPYCGTITERGSPVLHIDIAPLRSTFSGILHSKTWTMIFTGIRGWLCQYKYTELLCT